MRPLKFAKRAKKMNILNIFVVSAALRPCDFVKAVLRCCAQHPKAAAQNPEICRRRQVSVARLM